MSTESFESIVNAAMEKVYSNGEIAAIEVAGILGMLSGAHYREIRDTAQHEFACGYHAGQHSMDAEHRAVAMRLRQLPRGCTGFSDAHVSWFADLAWAMGIKEPTFAVLRDELVRLMGGVSDGTDEPMTTDELIKYINQDTRRLKGDASKTGDGDEMVHAGGHSGVFGCACDAVRGDVDGEHALGVSCHHSGSHVADGMVPVDVIGGADDTCGAGCCCAAADSDGDCGLQREEVSDGRVVDDSVCDTSGSYRGVSVHLDGLKDDGTCPNDVRASSITDELREWASDRHCKGMSHTDVLNIGLIADRIDEQFDRICQQQEAVLQETIDEMAGENLTAKDERDHWKREASELQAKLDEYDRTHVELPRDANGKVFNIGCAVKPVKRDTKLAYTVSYMDLAKDGWRIGIWLDQYRLKYKPQTFEVCDAKPDPIEDTIEKLTLGEITQTEAIERIKSLGQE